MVPGGFSALLQDGAAIGVNGVLNLTRAYITNSRAGASGGGIGCVGDTFLRDVLIVNCSAGVDSGGVGVLTGRAVMRNVTVVGCYAAQRGASVSVMNDLDAEDVSIRGGFAAAVSNTSAYVTLQTTRRPCQPIRVPWFSLPLQSIILDISCRWRLPLLPSISAGRWRIAHCGRPHQGPDSPPCPGGGRGGPRRKGASASLTHR